MYSIRLGIGKTKEGKKKDESGKKEKIGNLNKLGGSIRVLHVKFQTEIQENLLKTEWLETLRSINRKTEELEKIKHSSDKLKTKDLSEAFEKSLVSLEKLNKEITNLATKNTKFEKEELTKSFIPKLAKVKNPDSAKLKEINDVLKTIQDGIQAMKSELGHFSKLLNECHERLKPFENFMGKLLLVDTLEDSYHRLDKLGQRYEVLCKSTAEMQARDNPASFEPAKVQLMFSELTVNHEKNGRLLEQSRANFERVFPPEEKKQNSSRA